jgi:hypothetical protein
MNVLVFNPGSNSLKAEVVRCLPGQQAASDGVKVIDIIVEGVGKAATLSRYRGKERFCARIGLALLRKRL